MGITRDAHPSLSTRQNAVLQSAVLPVAEQAEPQTPVFDPSRTALLVMHYQTDIMELFRSPPPCSQYPTAVRRRAARGVAVFAKIHFSPGYPEVSP